MRIDQPIGQKRVFCAHELEDAAPLNKEDDEMFFDHETYSEGRIYQRNHCNIHDD